MRFRLLVLLLVFTLFPIVAPSVSAQSISLPSADQPFNIAVNPEVPGPNTQVVIRAEASDIGNAVVSWDLDGKRALSGYGKNQFVFTTGAAGKSTTVVLSVAYTGKPLVTRTFTFTPSDVALVWESNTYTPPFYAGRARYSRGAVIRVTAFPDIRNSAGARVPNSSLSFAWQRGDQFVADASGIGKNTYVFFGDQVHDSETVHVSIMNTAGTPVASKEITIPASDPTIVFYQRDGFGTIDYTRTLKDGVEFVGNEATIVAEPYYFSATSRSDPHLTFAWRLNGNDVAANGAQGLLSVRTQTDGQAQFDLEIQNTRTYQILQGATAAFKAAFKSNTPASSFFSL